MDKDKAPAAQEKHQETSAAHMKDMFKKAAVEQTSTQKKAAAEQTSVQKKAVVDQTPAQKKAGTDQTPAQKKAGTDQTPAQKKAGTDQTPAQKKAGADQTPAQKKAGADQTHAQKKAGTDQTPAQKPVSDNTPSQKEAAAEQTRSQGKTKPGADATQPPTQDNPGPDKDTAPTTAHESTTPHKDPPVQPAANPKPSSHAAADGSVPSGSDTPVPATPPDPPESTASDSSSDTGSESGSSSGPDSDSDSGSDADTPAPSPRSGRKREKSPEDTEEAVGSEKKRGTKLSDRSAKKTRPEKSPKKAQPEKSPKKAQPEKSPKKAQPESTKKGLAKATKRTREDSHAGAEGPKKRAKTEARPDQTPEKHKKAGEKRDASAKKGTHDKQRKGAPPAPTKPRRWRPGTVTRRYIKRYQKTTFNLIPRESFLRLVKEKVGDRGKPSEGFVNYLHTFSEENLVKLFSGAYRITLARDRVRIKKDDLELMKMMGMDPKNHSLGGGITNFTHFTTQKNDEFESRILATHAKFRAKILAREAARGHTRLEKVLADGI